MLSNDHEKIYMVFLGFLSLIHPLAGVISLLGIHFVSGLISHHLKVFWPLGRSLIYRLNLFLASYGCIQTALQAGYGPLTKPFTICWLVGVFPLTYLLTYLFENARTILGWPSLVFPALISLGGFCLSLDLVPFTDFLVQPPNTSTYLFYGAGLVAAFGMKSPLTFGSLIFAPLPALIFGFKDSGLAVGTLAFLVTFHLPWVPSITGVFWSLFATMAALIISSLRLPGTDVTLFHEGDKFQSLLDVGSILIGTALGLMGEFLHRPGVWTHRWFIRPEDRLGYAAEGLFRFRSSRPGIGCPFLGTWTVYQGFSGPWTHRGYFQYALDFVQKDSIGLSHKGNPYNLADYYAFGQDLVAPVSGMIVACYDGYLDQPIGSVDNEHRWGNFIIIQDEYGRSIIIAHLKQNSIKVKNYDYVCQGQVLGQCGNSGYSPEPHIHIQVQVSAYLGQPTLPFFLLNYFVFGSEDSNLKKARAPIQWFSHGVPQEGDLVSAPKININLDRSLSFIIGDSFKFFVLNQGDQDNVTPIDSKELTITNCLDDFRSLMYLTDGQARLYHYKHNGQIVFFDYTGPHHHPLRDLLIACPRIPLVFHSHLEWTESFYGIGDHGFGLKSLPTLGLLRRSAWNQSKTDWNSVKFEFHGNALRLSSHNPFLGVNTFCQFDPLDGITQYGVGGRNYGVLSLKRVLSANISDNKASIQNDVLMLG